MTVTALLPPDPNLYPGGAVAVTPATSQPAGATADCLPVGDPDVTVSFKASGLVLVGTTTGYAGRPSVVTDPATDPDFELRYVDERTLSCPIMPDDPQAWPPAPADVTACEADAATCRATCERLLLARRARRLFYVTDVCPATTTALGQACADKWPGGLALPNPTGPALAFQVGTNTVAGTGAPALVRGATLYFNTASGQVATLRSPSVGSSGIGSTSPYGVILFDRSAATLNAADAIHGYAAFAYDLVLDFAPWAAQSNATTIR